MSKNNKSILTKDISDWIITIPITCVGLYLIFTLFYRDMSMHNRTLVDSFIVISQYFPLLYAAIYLFFKAVVSDIVRILRGIRVTMPAAVILAYAFQWFCMWLSYDLLYNGIGTRMGNSSPLKYYLLFKNPILLWIMVDLIVSLLLFVIHSYSRLHVIKTTNSTNSTEFEKLLSNSYLRSFFFFFVVIFLS